MLRFLGVAIAVCLASMVPCTSMAASSTPATTTPVTFYQDVLPILQRRCQGCHRPGEPAPMPLLTYETVRPWGKAIRQAVLRGTMPPWFADPHVGRFTNDRSLPQSEIGTLVSWIDGGSPAGDAEKAPPPLAFTDGWTIGKPDMIIEIPEAIAVPAKGTVEYTYVIVPTGLTGDRWVQMAEARPDQRAQVHHIIAFVRQPGAKWFRQYPTGKPFIPAAGGDDRGRGEFLTGYAPGSPPEILRPGQAKLLKAGSDIVFQMHYTANGKAVSDRSRVGIVFATAPVRQRVLTLAASNDRFVIPPGAPNHRVDGAITLYKPAELVSLMPHMHLRGKAMEISAVYPTGEREVLLRVPRYDFNWQLWYQLPPGKLLPAGTRIEASGYFDNSPNNKSNPDPAAAVRYGDQSWEEMMFGFFDAAIDAGMDPASLIREPEGSTARPAARSNGGR